MINQPIHMFPNNIAIDTSEIKLKQDVINDIEYNENTKSISGYRFNIFATVSGTPNTHYVTTPFTFTLRGNSFLMALDFTSLSMDRDPDEEFKLVTDVIDLTSNPIHPVSNNINHLGENVKINLFIPYSPKMRVQNTQDEIKGNYKWFVRLYENYTSGSNTNRGVSSQTIYYEARETFRVSEIWVSDLNLTNPFGNVTEANNLFVKWDKERQRYNFFNEISGLKNKGLIFKIITSPSDMRIDNFNFRFFSVEDIEDNQTLSMIIKEINIISPQSQTGLLASFDGFISDSKSESIPSTFKYSLDFSIKAVSNNVATSKQVNSNLWKDGDISTDASAIMFLTSYTVVPFNNEITVTNQPCDASLQVNWTASTIYPNFYTYNWQLLKESEQNSQFIKKLPTQDASSLFIPKDLIISYSKLNDLPLELNANDVTIIRFTINDAFTQSTFNKDYKIIELLGENNTFRRLIYNSGKFSCVYNNGSGTTTKNLWNPITNTEFSESLIGNQHWLTVAIFPSGDIWLIGRGIVTGTIPASTLYPSSILYPKEINVINYTPTFAQNANQFTSTLPNVTTSNNSVNTINMYGHSTINLLIHMGYNEFLQNLGFNPNTKIPIGVNKFYNISEQFDVISANFFFKGFHFEASMSAISDGYLIGYDIYRRDLSERFIKKIMETSAGANVLRDYAVSNNSKYIYMIFGVVRKKDNTIIYTNPIISDECEVSFWDWVLMDLVPKITGTVEEGGNGRNQEGYYTVEDMYLFGSNVTTGSQSNNVSVQLQPNFSAYPKAFVSSQNYESFTITATHGNMTKDKMGKDAWDTNIERLRAFRASFNNGRLKMLKDRRGGVFIVSPSSALEEKVMDESREQLTDVTFSLVAIAHSNIIKGVINKTRKSDPTINGIINKTNKYAFIFTSSGISEFNTRYSLLPNRTFQSGHILTANLNEDFIVE